MQSPTKKRIKQQQFQQEINQIVKRIKQKQQINLDLIEYIQHIFNCRHQLQHLVFVQDQISKYRNFLDKVTYKMNQLIEMEKIICANYSKQIQLQDSQKILIKRVCARILELFQLYNQKVQKYTHFEQQISEHYKSSKLKFIRLINTIERNDFNLLNVSQIFKAFFQYSNKKFQSQKEKLQKIRELIQNGQISQIQQVLHCQHCQQLQLSQPQSLKSTKKLLNSEYDNVNEKSSHNFPQKPYQSSSLSKNNFSKQKQKIKERLKIMRQQSKQKQLIRKKRQKFANKYVSLYQSAMDLHKGYLMDQLVTTTDQKVHSDKMMGEIVMRNRINQNFIRQFICECEEKKFTQKINNRSTFSLRELNNSQYLQTQENESEDINFKRESYYLDPSNDKSNFKSLQNNFYQLIIKKDRIRDQIQENEKNEIKSFRITTSNKKTITPTPLSNPNLLTLKSQKDSFNFVKINMKNAAFPINAHRSRLPDISNRVLSMDKKRRFKKNQEAQQAPNNNPIMKTSLTKTIDSKSTNKNVKKSQSNHKIILQKKIKGSAKTLEIKYSTSVSKKLNKFCQIISEKQYVY